MKLILALLLALLVFLLALAVGAQNEQLVQVNYLIAQSTLPLSVLMAICLVSGILLSLIIGALWFISYRIRARRRSKVTQASPGA
ncbi:LapA family protein [Lacimicrobium sp. SS2-24]|uniref:lipopolysaccharide assembly protein LapA domain-containing protein n=1 Tax=Lacimicrobium sp. SS2-24 TaxID=2005569 RepID=UPI000B4AFFD5|nr:LapA family protein [Lacimicrobium sp. SS2-24]